VSLLSDQDRGVVREHLARIQHPVTLLLFTQTIGAPETALIARQVLDELASLNDLIRVEEVNFVLEKDRAAQYGIDHIPAIVLLSNDTDTRMRFLGAPAGYEFMSLIEAVMLAGTDDSQLDPQSRELIAANVTAPVDIHVFVTPTCPHCPRAVSLAHRMARESAHIRATCVEATEFMDLSRKFRVTGVPKTVVNESIEILGALPEELFVRGVLGLPEADPPPSA
jgi:glutaredoxin-like protein